MSTAPPPAGGSTLVISNASPSDGDATLTAMATTRVVDGYQFSITQALGSPKVYHFFTAIVDGDTFAIKSVSHSWTTGSGTTCMTACVAGSASPCDPQEVQLDFSGRKMTFSNLVILDNYAGGTVQCTLNGDVVWNDIDPYDYR